MVLLLVLTAAPLANAARGLSQTVNADDAFNQMPKPGVDEAHLQLPGSQLSSSQKAKMLHRAATATAGTGAVQTGLDAMPGSFRAAVKAAKHEEEKAAAMEAIVEAELHGATQEEEEVDVEPETLPKNAKIFRFSDPKQMKEYIYRTRGQSYKDGKSRVILPVHWARVPKKNTP